MILKKRAPMSKKSVSTGSTIKVVTRSNRKLWSIVVIGLLTVGILTAWLFYGITKASENSSNETSTVSTQKVERSLTGKSIDDDRKAALAAATDVLNLAGNSPTGGDFSVRLKALDEGDTKVVDPELVKSIRFKDVFADSNEMKNNTYQSLITLSTLIKNSTGSSTITPTSDTMWKNVYVDAELGTAFVPMAIYAGPSSSFSMEMVYVDGDWKLAPYSLLDSVKLSAKLQLAAEAAKTK
jgi:hypothetical protein